MKQNETSMLLRGIGSWVMPIPSLYICWCCTHHY